MVGRRRLYRYAAHKNISFAKLVSWYQDDIEILGNFTEEEFLATVEDCMRKGVDKGAWSGARSAAVADRF